MTIAWGILGTARTNRRFLAAAAAIDEVEVLAVASRRLEWKCDSLNVASRRAAERFGFRFEGVFRNHMVIKGHNRDTAWYAITGDEWPRLAAGFAAFLAADNFDAEGRQRRPLAELIAVAPS